MPATRRDRSRRERPGLDRARRPPPAATASSLITHAGGRRQPFVGGLKSRRGPRTPTPPTLPERPGPLACP
ncbi:hypothetical protein FTX61_13400 [Nitriliruptoraceae bacterium ZYF776]|nr:hypothetical protein [Profundirhabdus halotolerans]